MAVPWSVWNHRSTVYHLLALRISCSSDHHSPCDRAVILSGRASGECLSLVDSWLRKPDQAVLWSARTRPTGPASSRISRDPAGSSFHGTPEILERQMFPKAPLFGRDSPKPRCPRCHPTLPSAFGVGEMESVRTPSKRRLSAVTHQESSARSCSAHSSPPSCCRSWGHWGHVADENGCNKDWKMRPNTCKSLHEIGFRVF